MKEWNAWWKYSRWSKSSHSSSTMLVRLTQIISTSSKYKKIKRHTSWHLRFFITTHPTSCVRLHGETRFGDGEGHTEPNKHPVTKTGSCRTPQALRGMGSIQCKRAAWSIMKTCCSASMQPSKRQQRAPEKRQSRTRAAFTLTVNKPKVENEKLEHVLCLQRHAYKLTLQLHPQKGLEVSKTSSPNIFGIYL